MEEPKTATECAEKEVELRARRDFLRIRLEVNPKWEDFVDVCRINNKLKWIKAYRYLLWRDNTANLSRGVKVEKATEDPLG